MAYGFSSLTSDRIWAPCIASAEPCNGPRHRTTREVSFLSFNFCFSFFLWPYHTACGILIPRPGIEPTYSAVKAQSPNQWTMKEFPHKLFWIHIVNAAVDRELSSFLEWVFLVMFGPEGEQTAFSVSRSRQANRSTELWPSVQRTGNTDPDLHARFQAGAGSRKISHDTVMKSSFIWLPGSSNSKESACNSEDPG